MSMSGVDPEFEALLEFVRDSRGFDYAGYKRPTLIRRFEQRMDEVGVDGYAAYRRYLEREPDEFAALFDTILINVTGFFRDPAAWEYVAAEVVPRIVDQRDGDRQIRVWSAGCASGAEAYTIAIVLAEALGQEAFRERARIYATDVDDDALRYARHASYTAEEVADVPEALRDRYFEPLDGRHSFRNAFGRAVAFGHNDLLQDPPLSCVDLLVSRNTLMYFGREAQDRILANFFSALRPRGYLMLGKAEALDSRTSLFQPVDVTRRVFVKDNGAHVPAAEPRPALEDELRDELASARRDLVAANEELWSTVEDLERTNSELGSTNEELEAMNEELRSMNEELEAMNDEMRVRADEALHANAFLSSILSSVPQGIVVVDRELRITAWSRAAAETWGPREDEARDEHLLTLDIGIPAGELRDPIRKVLAGEPQEQLVLQGHDRRGEPVECAITFDPLRAPLDTVAGVILVMVVERV